MRERAEVSMPATGARASSSLLSASLAELVGTFLLVFAGTGTVVAVVLAAPEAPPNVTAIALAFGFAVLVVVYAFGHVSGAHINPAVTIALAVVRKFPWAAVPIYVGAQLAGAILASLAVWALFGGNARSMPLLLGATVPGEQGAGAAFLAEVVLGFLLVVVIMGTATDDRASAPAVGLGVGLIIAVGIFATLPISGASFNPARSLGPMIVAGQFPGWWVYLIAPTLGGVLGALLYDFVLRSGSPPAIEGAIEERPNAPDESMA